MDASAQIERFVEKPKVTLTVLLACNLTMIVTVSNTFR